MGLQDDSPRGVARGFHLHPLLAKPHSAKHVGAGSRAAERRAREGRNADALALQPDLDAARLRLEDEGDLHWRRSSYPETPAV